MTEEDYIDRMCLAVDENETPLATLKLADEAVAAYPNSAKLWCRRGNLIELGVAESPYSLEDALACFERAVAVDPDFVEGYEEIGHFFDAIMADSKRAKSAFRKAAAIRKRHAKPD